MVIKENQSPDYLRGLSDGLKEGYNTAMEQLHFLSQQQSIRLEMSPEKLQELKKEINEIPMPLQAFNPETLTPSQQKFHDMLYNPKPKENYMNNLLKKYGRNKA